MPSLRKVLDRLSLFKPPTASDPLDAYAHAAPHPQQTIDIFKGAWSSKFPSDTAIAAGTAELFADPRLRAALDRIDVRGLRVLELGPLEGAHSSMLQAAGAGSVRAIEACALSYLKCLIVKDLLALDRVAFEFGDFMPFLAATPDRFDLIVASGVLYHQRDPIECIRRLALHSECVYLWTHYVDPQVSSQSIRRNAFRRSRSAPVDGFACDLFRLDYDAYLPGMKYRGGVDDHSHWMARPDLLACLAYFGLGEIDILGEQTDHPYGPNITMLARRGPAQAPTVVARRQRQYADQLRDAAGPEPWCIDAVAIDGSTLTVSGWAIPPGGDPSRAAVLVNGVAARSVTTEDRPDVDHYYWFFPGAATSGFDLRALLPNADGDIALHYVDRTTGAPLDPWHAAYVRPSDLLSPAPVPPLAHIVRAHAGNTPNQYLVEGYSIFVKLQQALHQTHGKRFDDFETVLDFGCGCGRVTRYLPTRGRAHTMGVDVDGDSIAWCRDSLPGDFCVCGVLPPLDVAPASIDAVIAIDVFNHFREADGMRWLEELTRVCRRGGVLLLSIASARALTRARLGADHYASLRDRDFVDLSANGDLDGVIEDPDYYRNVFHSHRYVRERWDDSRRRVVGIFPGLVGNHNDLVVLEVL